MRKIYCALGREVCLFPKQHTSIETPTNERKGSGFSASVKKKGDFDQIIYKFCAK